VREQWAPVVEFPEYLVSTYGRVKSPFGTILRSGGRTQGGCIQYHFYVDSRRYVRYLHRVVAEAFIGSVTGFEIDHLDDNNTNNYVGNLEIVTPKTNSQRAYDRGRRVPPRMIAVRIVETGEEFRSVSDCARALNRSLSSVWYALKNGTPTAKVHLEEVMP
jgi:hypothetical protein